jgi:hypothetical protein
MRRTPWLSAASLLAVLAGCAAHAGPATTGPATTHAQTPARPSPAADRVVAEALAPAPPGADLTGWFCPMHPDVTGDGPGACQKCGMAFVVGRPFDMRDYLLDLDTAGGAVSAGEPFTMTLRVRHPQTLTATTNFEVVHDKRYHLFVVSQDLTSFQHLHPEQQPDGGWTISLTLPRPGYYRVLSDFLPVGGSPQFLGRTLVTAGFDGDLLSQSARLEPDDVLRKTAGTITAELDLEPARLVAGEYGHLGFTLTDAASGEPITDLEPYLGAFGHTLILSEDLQDYVHSHPLEGPLAAQAGGLGGPRVAFEGYLPRPGRYRAWTQFQRHGALTTVSFTFRVYSLAEAVRDR